MNMWFKTTGNNISFGVDDNGDISYIDINFITGSDYWGFVIYGDLVNGITEDYIIADKDQDCELVVNINGENITITATLLDGSYGVRVVS